MGQSQPGSDRTFYLFGLCAFAFVVIGWYRGLVIAPTEHHQGEVYRIIYFHVPSAFTAFLSAFSLLAFSLITLFKRSESAALLGKASAEVGLIFTVITLLTGSIWGRPTWGVWWTWDARLTTTLILALLYAGYLIFYSSMSPGPQRDRISATLGIVIALDVPVIYGSVYWWRTLHQPPSIMRPGGSTMDSDMFNFLLFNAIGIICFAAWMVILRYKNLKLEQKLEQLGFDAQR